MKLWFEVFTAITLVAIAIWEFRQLARYPRDAALRILVPGVTCLAVVVTLGIPVQPLEPLDNILEEVHFSNFAWAFMVYCFAAFFLLAGSGTSVRSLAQRKRQARWEFCLFVVSLSAMLVVSKAAPPGTWHTPRIPADYRTWQNIVFYLCADGYVVLAWLVGVRRAVRVFREMIHPWARLATAIVVLGASMMVIGVDVVSLIRQSLYIIFPGSKWPMLSDVYNIGRLGGQILLALGLALAPLLALIPRGRDRYDQILRTRYEQRLVPLWSRLMHEFPYLTLPRSDMEKEVDGSYGGFERMTVEITDGLAQLAVYCPVESGSNGGNQDPKTAAERVFRALKTLDENRSVRWAGGETEPMDPPYQQIEPDFGADWRGRARWMMQVGQEAARLDALVQGSEHRDGISTGQ